MDQFSPLTKPCFMIKLRYLCATISSLLCSYYYIQAQSDSLFVVSKPATNYMMKYDTTGGFTITGSLLSFNTPEPGVIDGGTRMMWIPNMGAFRAGTVHNDYWNIAHTGLHSLAIGEGVRASGEHSVALGRFCQATNVATFAMGDQCTATGAASVALGYHAHTNARQGSFVFGDRSTVDTIRAGVNHSANWRVSGGFRIFTSSNLSTGVTLQSGASVSNWGQSSAVISTSTGAYLSTSGVWNNASDINRKHLFEEVSGEDVLHLLRDIRVQKWSYKTDDDSIRHIGPMAQDFYKTFGLGSDEKVIGTVDADGVALAAIQALEKRTMDLSKELTELKELNKKLLERLDAMERKTTRN
jgi:hypothetical protein